MSAGNVRSLGAKRKKSAGFSLPIHLRGYFLSNGTISGHTGVRRPLTAKIYFSSPCGFIQRRSHWIGRTGRSVLREEIVTTVEKLQEPPPAKRTNPNSEPDESSCGVGYGMLGRAGSGQVVCINPSKQGFSQRRKGELWKQWCSHIRLDFKFAIRPVQGIELSNSPAHANQFGSGTQSTCFSETETFSKIRRT